MDDEQLLLLNNLLDALDRLYDRKLQVVDLWALTVATAAALTLEPLSGVLRRTAADLRDVVRAGLDSGEENRRALEVTGELRGVLADLL